MVLMSFRAAPSPCDPAIRKNRIEKPWATRVRSGGDFRCRSGALFGADSNASDRHAVQHRGTLQPPDKQRFRSSNGLKRKSCTKRRMRQRSEKSHAHELAAVGADIRRGK